MNCRQCKQMKDTDTDFLGEFEQTVMLAALRQPDGAYAVTIREEIESRTGRNVSRGAIYVTLDRLEKKGYLVLVASAGYIMSFLKRIVFQFPPESRKCANGIADQPKNRWSIW